MPGRGDGLRPFLILKILLGRNGGFLAAHSFSVQKTYGLRYVTQRKLQELLEHFSTISLATSTNFTTT